MSPNDIEPVHNGRIVMSDFLNHYTMLALVAVFTAELYTCNAHAKESKCEQLKSCV